MGYAKRIGGLKNMLKVLFIMYLILVIMQDIAILMLLIAINS